MKMPVKRVSSYEEAVAAINQSGILPLSHNEYGLVSLEDLTYPGAWHTGTAADPWLWKDRIAAEKKAAYTRLFAKKTLFISRDWYPYFLAAYRFPETLAERYQDGLVSNLTQRIFSCLQERGPLNTAEWKSLMGIRTKGEHSRFEKSVVELEQCMEITVSGVTRKINRKGEPYGWLVSEYDTVERWAGLELMQTAAQLSKDEAVLKIKTYVGKLVQGKTDKETYKLLGLKSS